MATEAGLGRPMAAGVDPTGNVVVAWSGSDGTSRRVRVSQADQSGRFTAPVDVSAPGADALLSDLEVGPTGRAIVVWDGGVEDPASVVRAAVAPTVVQPFGPPEDVSPPGQAARFAVAAFDPALRRADDPLLQPPGRRELVPDARPGGDAERVGPPTV